MFGKPDETPKRELWPNRRSVPFIPQLTPTDCGAASLAAVLAFHEKNVPIHVLRARLGGGRNGVNAKQILQTARSFGLRARGVQVTPDKLNLLPVGSILHWDLNHFVVFAGLKKDTVRVVDPAVGERTLNINEVAQSLSGVARRVEPGAALVRGKADRKGPPRPHPPNPTTPPAQTPPQDPPQKKINTF